MPAVVCLALGVGVNAAMLGTLDALLLRPPAGVQDVDSLKRLYFLQPSNEAPQLECSYPIYTDLAGAIDAFSGLAAYSRVTTSLGQGEKARQVWAGLATPSFFQVLGVTPAQGRLFLEAEGDPRQPGPVALVSWELWQGAFGGTPDIRGRTLPIGGTVYTVVGVLPRRFTGVELAPVDIWLPIGAMTSLGKGQQWAEDRESFFLHVVGRLQPGASAEQAEQQATAVHRRAYAALGDVRPGRRIALGPANQDRSPSGAQPIRLAAWLSGTSGAVLLIACFNVANLLVVRGLGRSRELAVRLALGAGRARLWCLLATESLLVALLGGAAAYAVERLSGALAGALLLPEGSPPPSVLDLRILTILATLSLGTAALCGLVTAGGGSRRDLTASLKGGSRGGGPGRPALRAVLLGGQVALSLVLLIGAGLFLRSLKNVRDLRLGFDPGRVLVVTVDLPSAGYKSPQIDTFFARALERVRLVPGVDHATVAAGIPFRSSFGTSIDVPGRGDGVGLAPGGIYLNAVADDFFATLGTAIRRGRSLSAEDMAGQESVAVVNETMAKLLWPGESALGKCFRIGGPADPCTSVVGVSEDARRVALQGERPTMQFYVPLPHAPEWVTGRALFVRTVADPDAIASLVRREVQALAPALPFVEARPLADLVNPKARPWRLGSVLFSLFGLVALTLAAVGTFGAATQVLAARTPELGVRAALGARPRSLRWQVMRSGFGVVTLGVAVGLALAPLGWHALEPLLFGVSPRDPKVIASAVLALLAAAFLASYWGAFKVRRIDPAAAMRNE